MTAGPGTSPRSGASSEESARVRELERRIHELESQGESAFGRFGALDWLVCALFALALPAAIVAWFAR